MTAAIKWGLITGAIYIIHALVGSLIGIKPGQSDPAMMGTTFLMNTVLFGITFFTIYSGVKDIRDNELEGYITFGTAFRAGMKIALIAGVIAAVFALINMYLINPGMMDELNSSMEEQYENMDDDKAAMSRKLMGMFNNPFAITIFTILYVAFWGVIKSLIIASILKKDPPVTVPVV